MQVSEKNSYHIIQQQLTQRSALNVSQTSAFAALVADAYASAADAITQAKAAAQSGIMLDSNKGPIRLEAYRASLGPTNGRSLDDIPLLLPSERTISGLAAYAGDALKSLLAQHGIEAPSSLSFDNYGQLQLPADYAQADALRSALNENPDILRDLRDVNALTSHYVEMKKNEPFLEAYADADSQAEVNAVLSQYAYLFSDNRASSYITLTFNENMQLVPQADGRSYNA